MTGIDIAVPTAPGHHRTQANPGAPVRPIAVFVHLARDKDPDDWRRAREAGTLVGVNDETPYGYGRADRMGCRVTISRSGRETAPVRLMRLGFRALLGFDLVHALRQGEALTQADVIWTHTESQYLAVAACLAARGAGRPKLLGQTIWLFDRWDRMSGLRRRLYRRLIGRVDLLTFHSRLNLGRAAALFPRHRTALVPFGIPGEAVTPPRLRAGSPIRVLSVGSDRDRDWATLVAAVRGCDDLSLVILSGTAPRALQGGNVSITRADTNEALRSHLDDATVVCVPLRPNGHASGITAIQEAVLAGVPVVTSDAGGLDLYFAPDEVRYVAAGDAAALRAALREIAADPLQSCAMATRAQQRMVDGTLGAEAFIRRHVELSREMLAHD